jgi:hypothetical protein
MFDGRPTRLRWIRDLDRRLLHGWSALTFFPGTGAPPPAGRAFSDRSPRTPRGHPRFFPPRRSEVYRLLPAAIPKPGWHQLQ